MNEIEGWKIRRDGKLEDFPWPSKSLLYNKKISNKASISSHLLTENNFLEAISGKSFRLSF